MGASQRLGLGHVTACCSGPIRCWQTGQVATQEAETEKKNSRQSVGVRQLVDEATVKDCDTREEMKGLILFGSQQET